MAAWYVNSHAVGTGAGTSWANATTTMAAAITLSAAGDDFYVASNHAETQASALTLTFKGTAAAPNRVFSTGTANTPPGAADLAPGASITTTGANAMTVGGNSVYIYGVTFNIGTGTTAANFTSTVTGATSFVEYDTCTFNFNVTTAASLFVGATTQMTLLTNCIMNFNGGAASGLGTTGSGNIRWTNTTSQSAVGGTASLTSLVVAASNRGSTILLDGLNLTGIASGKSIFPSIASAGFYQAINCQIAVGALAALSPIVAGVSVDFINSDSAATGYRQERYQLGGTLTAETTVIPNTSPASDGVQAISWKVVTTSNAKVQTPFECFPIAAWAAAGSRSATLQFLASAALTNKDVWVEVEYLGAAGAPLASLVSSAPNSGVALPLAQISGVNLTGSAVTWGGSIATPTPQQITVTWTQALDGLVRFNIKIGKASTTVYVDPYPIVT